jgi:cytochrome P450
MAGSETTASQLSGLTALLLRNSDCLKKLTAEVRSSFKSEQEISSTSVNSLKYLQACLNEGLRCYPPIAGGLPRIMPKGGNIIDGEHVAEGVSLTSFGPVSFML